MNVNITTPISITISTAKLVAEDSGQGTIEFSLLGQPVRLYISSNDYTYITNVNVGDRVKLIENFAGLNINSNGIVNQIIADPAEDQAIVNFDQIYPDGELNPIDVNIISTKPTVTIQVPMEFIQKL
jgi:hypothetical protein